MGGLGDDGGHNGRTGDVDGVAAGGLGDVRFGALGAREHLSAAAETFGRLGAHPWTDRANKELRACGIPVPARTLPGGALTAQQWEIARLAATGLTNKQIGERLLLSPRTVSTHLYQLFPKLGVTSRAALHDALAQLDRP